MVARPRRIGDGLRQHKMPNRPDKGIDASHRQRPVDFAGQGHVRMIRAELRREPALDQRDIEVLHQCQQRLRLMLRSQPEDARLRPMPDMFETEREGLRFDVCRGLYIAVALFLRHRAKKGQGDMQVVRGNALGGFTDELVRHPVILSCRAASGQREKNSLCCQASLKTLKSPCRAVTTACRRTAVRSPLK